MQQKELILIAAVGFSTIFAFQILEKLGINNTYIYFSVILAVTVIAATWYNRG